MGSCMCLYVNENEDDELIQPTAEERRAQMAAAADSRSKQVTNALVITMTGRSPLQTVTFQAIVLFI